MPKITEIVINNKKTKKRRQRKKNRSSNNNNNNNNQRTVALINNAPIASNTKRAPRVPRMRQSRDGFVVTHREYISDITANSAAFSIVRFNINPGLASTFPWLSSVANRYESYIFDRLNFIYEPICPTTTPGSILMAVDYDAADSTPVNKVQMMSYRDSVRSSPWDRRTFSAHAHDLKKFGVQRYMRDAALTGSLDVKTYDVGGFFIASQNTPAAVTTLGELYVEYTVRLFTPQISPSNFSNQANNISQYGTIVIPANGLPIFQSVVDTAGTHPMMWLDPTNGTTGNVRLLFNFLNSGPGLFRIYGTNANFDSGGLLRTFTDAQWGNTARSGLRFNLVSPNYGFPQSNAANLQQYTYYIRNPGLLNTFGSGLSGILPIQITRPSGATEFSYNVSFTPTVGDVLTTSSFPTASGTWGFPPVDLPDFTNVGLSERYVDAVNQIVRGRFEPGEDSEDPKRSLLSRLFK